MAKLRNARSGFWLANELMVTKNFWQAAKGLLGQQGLAPGAGLYIAPCQSIHSWFMQFPFDAIFVDGNWRVLHLIHSMPPFRISAFVWHARGVVELPAGVILATDTRKGDLLEFLEGATYVISSPA